MHFNSDHSGGGHSQSCPLFKNKNNDPHPKPQVQVEPCLMFKDCVNLTLLLVRENLLFFLSGKCQPQGILTSLLCGMLLLMYATCM